MYTYFIEAHQIFSIYIPSLVNIFVSGIYLAVTCEVDIAVGCVVAYVCKYVWPVSFSLWLYDICLQPGNHICSIADFKYLYSDAESRASI